MNNYGKRKSPFVTRRGQALVEVVIATLIAAMTTVSVFSVVLSSEVSQIKADKKDAATYILKLAQETLKSYVSADPLNSNIVPGSADAQTGSPVGPGGAGRWAADSGGQWALAAGRHDISSLINNYFPALQKPGETCVDGGNCYLVYTVTNDDCLNVGNNGTYGSPSGGVTGNAACKTVEFTLKYPD